MRRIVFRSSLLLVSFLAFFFLTTPANAVSDFLFSSYTACYNGTKVLTDAQHRCYNANWRINVRIENYGTTSNENEPGVMNSVKGGGWYYAVDWGGNMNILYATETNNIILVPGEYKDIYKIVVGTLCDHLEFSTQGSYIDVKEERRSLDVDNIKVCNNVTQTGKGAPLINKRNIYLIR